MLLLVDRSGAQQFAFRTAAVVNGDSRRYYCAQAPIRAILVCRSGLELQELIGQVVDARIGNDAAWRDFVRPGQEGRPHTKVTIYRPVRGHPQRTLSSVLRDAPRE